jgi:transmembrane sensor
MLDKEFHIAGLIKKQLNSELDEQSGEELQQWLSKHPSNSEFYTKIIDPENFHQRLSEFESADSEELWRLTLAKVAETGTDKVTAKPVIVKLNWFRFAAAAAAVAFMVSAGIWFFKDNGNRNLQPIVYASDVAAGHQGATLTLANGKKNRLNPAQKGLVPTAGGVTISKTATGQLVYAIKGDPENNRTNTLSTERGETYQVQLPDGSEVWLNAASSLTYATNLITEGKRVVKLTGEGYFQVAKDKAHPFQVQTGDHQVEVLGTHFNINSYPNEPAITTTLLEGSVKVSFRSTTKLLKPGQQAKLDSKGDLRFAQVDTDTYVAWKNKQFSFEDENIQAIMRMVERWYDVKIEYSGQVSEEKFWGGVSRSDNVSKVLNALESTGKVRFEIKGNTIYVFKNDR